MRIDRFEGQLHQIIGRAGPPYQTVETFGQAGITDARYGLVVHLATGATLHLQLIQIRPDGERADEDEQIVEGPPPEPVAVPDLPARASVRLEAIDEHLRALITGARHPEIARVTRRGDDPGLTVHMHSGRRIVIMHRYALRPGEHPREAHRPRAEV